MVHIFVLGRFSIGNFNLVVPIFVPHAHFPQPQKKKKKVVQHTQFRFVHNAMIELIHLQLLHKLRQYSHECGIYYLKQAYNKNEVPLI